MPMIPEALFAMLACARIGAVHSVVFGGFAAKELATRIDDAEPKLVLTASCGVEPGRLVEYKPLLDLAIGLAKHKPQACVVFQRPQLEGKMFADRDHDWAALVAATRAAGKRAPCVELAATDPLYILYTSGTTGTPKGVVRDIGGYCVALKWSMSAIYGVEPGETYWAASDIGWVVGHSYIVYAPLLHGCATILYEGKPIGTPDAGAFWRVVEEYQVAAFFTAPTALRAVRKEDPHATLLQNYNIASMRTLFLAGERADPDTVAWAEHVLESPGGRSLVADRDRLGDRRQSGRPRPAAGQARLADRADAGLRRSRSSTRAAIPCRPGRWARSSSSCRCRPAACRRSIATTSACAPATSRTSPATTRPSDAGFKDEDGYLTILGRTDDIINVAGHRLSTGGMEEVVASHPAVAECAVLGVKDEIKGEQPVRLHRAEVRRRPAARRDRARGRRAGARQDRPGRRVQAGRSSSSACPRPARARSCAAR